MKLIDFFIIGTQKAGTTSLYRYLIQHPEIYFSEVKELKYFIDTSLYNKGIEYLNAFFYRYANQKIIGTSHVHMLPCSDAPKKVFNYNSNAKFIVLLREPISRAYSAFQYAQKNNWEKKALTLSEGFQLENERLKLHPTPYDLLYFNNGLYFKHLANWQKVFPKTQFLLITTTKLKEQPQETLNLIFSFLNLHPYKIDYSKQYNIESKARFPSIQTFIFANTKAKKFIGGVLPNKTKVWIRSKLFTKLTLLNSKPITKKNSQSIQDIDDIELERYKSFFSDDMKHLKEEYGIKFET